MVNKTVDKKASSKGIFWGWYVVAGAFLILSINYGARYSFGVFLKPLSDEYGWSRSIISLGASINMFVYSACAIFIGRLADRVAPRWIITAGALAGSCSYLLMSIPGAISGPLYFFMIYGVLAGIGSAAMGAVAVNSCTARWFRKKRGVAIGLSSMGVSFGTITLTPAAGCIVKELDWQAGFAFFGVLFLAGIVLAQLLMGKSSPESCGLQTDGSAGSGDPPDEVNADNSPGNITYSEMLSDSRFWVIGISAGLAYMTMMTAIVHQVPFAEDRGIDRLTASASIGVLGFAGFLGQFFFGWLSDRVKDVKYSAILGAAFMLAGLLILKTTGSQEALFVYSLVYGFGYGFIAPMLPILAVDRFGRQALGSVYGMMVFIVGIGGSAGPFIAGFIFDRYGSYDLVWLAGIVILAAVCILLATLRRGRTTQ